MVPTAPRHRRSAWCVSAAARARRCPGVRLTPSPRLLRHREIECLRHTAHMRRPRRGELCVEATLSIAELVGVDAVTERTRRTRAPLATTIPAPSTPGTRGNRGRPGVSRRTLAYRSIPAANAGRLDRLANHLVRPWPRHWKRDAGSGPMADRIDRPPRLSSCRGYHWSDSRPDPFMTVELDLMNGVDEPRGLSLQSDLHAPAHQDTVGFASPGDLSRGRPRGRTQNRATDTPPIPPSSAALR